MRRDVDKQSFFFSLRQSIRYAQLYSRPVYFLIFLVSLGSVGFIFIENYNFIDSLYMTVITISTVGFGAIRPFSDVGKVFVLILILGGVMFYGIAVNSMLKTFMKKSFRGFMKEELNKNKIATLKNHFIVCGGGRMAYSICLELEKQKEKFVIIENDEDSEIMNVINTKEFHWLILNRNALLDDSLVEAGIYSAKGVFAVLSSDADNLFAVLSARQLNEKVIIETRISNDGTRPKMLQAGANKVLSPYSVGGLQMARRMLRPEVDDFFEVVRDQLDYEFEMKIHKIQADDDFHNKSLNTCPIRQHGYIAIAIKHSDGTITFAPPADYTLRVDEEVFLIGKGDL